MPVGDWTSFKPGGSVPDQPGPVMAYACALPPVVRDPATSNTSDHPSSIGMM